MKKLGLIGGIGPESTIAYYHDIIYGVQRITGHMVVPPLVIENLSVFEVLKMCEKGNYRALSEYMINGIRNLVAAGAEFIAMTGNTPHIVFDEIARRSPVPVVSIVETCCTEAKKRGYHKIGLLGTVPTMRGDFFKKPFIPYKINIVVPTEEEISFIGEKILKELELGIVKDKTFFAVQKIIQHMISEQGIEAVVLGCTELPLLFKNKTLDIPTLDIMQIHIDTLVDMIVESPCVKQSRN